MESLYDSSTPLIKSKPVSKAKIAIIVLVIITIVLSLISMIFSIKSSNLKQQILFLQSELHQVKNSVDVSSRDINNLESQIKKADSKIVVVQSNVDDIASGVSNVRKDIDIVKSDINTVKDNITNVKDNINIVKSDVNTVKDDVGRTLPNKFSVDKSYILPPTNQMNIGSCWCFSMIYLLESQYHAKGVLNGFLDEDEYVSFSKQAFFTWLGDQCHKYPEVKACKYGGLMQNSSEDQQIESLYYFAKAWEETKTSVLPESVCPYREKEDDPDWKFMYCPNLYDALQEGQNPLKWDIVSFESAYNIDDIKRLLKKSGRALGIGVPLPNLVYYLPCNNTLFKETTECQTKTIPCPNGNEYCYKLELDARQQDGIFLGNVDPMYMSELGGHAMNLVGYNDEWIYRNRYQRLLSANIPKGGFILHNSWRQEGHSVDYFMGKLSEENEAVICPNHKTPFNWIPATLDCIQQNTNNGKFDYTKCSTDIKRIRGKNYTKGADILQCKSSSSNICDDLHTYVLLRKNEYDAFPDVDVLPGGVNNIKMASISSETSEIKEIEIKSMPFWALSQIFQPYNETFVPNDDYNCGYWMLPYQTLENMQRINWDFLDNFRVFDLQVDFANQSYEKQSMYYNYNYTLLKQSTKRIQRVEFDGPLPYQYIF
ncbi:papain family cysteine protease domain containing protein [Histomonas meleagridis]|uniref:papain family cysteine protease domain containing protein n=1 Tax=Histomonas meleagridis TaxID=135588 RepID=UPI00355AAB1F|nr:papain family cysteine protease domain containing protein [Histomonas meleagridis]KAH0806584.1 papain family cysteine protease domain containing protein [Histomonas meleagridis]